MRTEPAALLAHMRGESVTICTCSKIELTDGRVYGFTDLDYDVTVDNITYIARTGYTPSAYSSSANLSVDNMEIEMIWDTDLIKEQELLSGAWDNALVTTFIVNYMDLSMGQLKLRTGRIGTIKRTGEGKFVCELQGQVAQVQTANKRVVQQMCDANLGDSRCKYTVTTLSGLVTGVESNKAFFDTSRTEVKDYFKGGTVKFTSGAAAGITMEVFSYDNASKRIELFLPLPAEIAVGDTFEIRQGCNRTFKACKEQFNNVINFRGFNLVGQDALTSGE